MSEHPGHLLLPLPLGGPHTTPQPCQTPAQRWDYLPVLPKLQRLRYKACPQGTGGREEAPQNRRDSYAVPTAPQPLCQGCTTAPAQHLRAGLGPGSCSISWALVQELLSHVPYPAGQQDPLCHQPLHAPSTTPTWAAGRSNTEHQSGSQMNQHVAATREKGFGPPRLTPIPTPLCCSRIRERY